MVYLQKGKKKLDVNSIFGENYMILKKFYLGISSPIPAPVIEGKKAWLPIKFAYKIRKFSILFHYLIFP
jgi:hypothetical protein